MGKEYGGDGVTTKHGGHACNPSSWNLKQKITSLRYMVKPKISGRHNGTLPQNNTKMEGGECDVGLLGCGRGKGKQKKEGGHDQRAVRTCAEKE